MDDVRVRLSAEGITEVVAALRKVATESKKTAQGADSAFKDLNHTLEATKSLMEGFGLLIVYDKIKQLSDRLVEFGKETARAAIEQKELAQSVGTTVGHMSGLSSVAVLTRTKSETLVSGLGRLGDNIDKLKARVPSAVAAFARLGKTAKDFPSNDIAVNAEIVARAMSRMADGTTKSAIATDLMGKSGRNLLPFFDKLVELKGLAGAVNLAQRSGFYVGDVAIAQLDAMDQKFKILQLYAQGAALSVFEGFGPSLVEVLDTATEATGNSRNAFEKFGEILGVVLRVARATVLMGLSPLVETMVLLIETTKTAYGLTQLIRAGAPGRDIASFARAATAQIGRDLQKVQDAAGRSVVDIFRKPDAVPGAGEDLRAEALVAQQRAQERFASLREVANSEVQLLQEKNRRLEEADSQLYARGKLSLQEYFSNRNDRINAEYAAELRLFAIRRQAALAEPDPEVRADKLRVLDNERLARQEKYATQGLAFEEEYRTKRLALLAAINSAEDQVRAAQGRTLDAALRKADDYEREQRVRLGNLPGMTQEMAAAQAESEAEVLRAKARFDDLVAVANLAVQSFDTARAKIEQDVAAHVLTQAQGQRAIAALEAERLPGLQAISAELKTGAEGLGPENQAKVDEFTLKVAKLKAVVQSLSDDMKGAFKGALTDFLGSGINQVHNLIDAFQQLGAAIAAAIQQKIAARAAGAITDFIFGAVGLADGGLVTGPGGPRDDRIPARLSAGEYIVPAHVVRQPGMLADLEELRRGTLIPHLRPPSRGYADGGLVAPAAGRPGVDGRVTVELGEGLIGRIVDHPKFGHGVLRTVGKNPRTIRGMLGN